MSGQLSGDLIRLLEIKKELLVKLLDAVKRAAECLRDEDMDAFSLEMENCKDLMTMADETGATADNLRRQAADPQHPELDRLESDIAYISGQVEQAHRECNDIAEHKLNTYGQQIKAIRCTRKGIDGYASQFQSKDSVFIDAKK